MAMDENKGRTSRGERTDVMAGGFACGDGGMQWS